MTSLPHSRWMTSHRSVPRRIWRQRAALLSCSPIFSIPFVDPILHITPWFHQVSQLSYTAINLASRKARSTDGSFANSELSKEIALTGRLITTGIEVPLRRLAELGSRNPRQFRMLLTSHCLSTMSASVSHREMAVKHFKPTPKVQALLDKRFPDPADQAIVTDAYKLGEALLALAIFYNNPYNIAQLGGLASWMLRFSVEVGNLEAAMQLWRIETAKGSPDVPALARTLVKDAAMSRKNIHAMMLYIDYIHQYPRTEPDSTTLEFILARDLWEMTTAGNQLMPVPKYISQYVQPWKLVSRASDKYLNEFPQGPYADEARTYYTTTLVNAAKNFSDPEACNILADDPSIKIYSESWINLKTQVAMSGNAEACFQMGKYYLEKYGWYPCPATPPKTKYDLDIDPMGEIGLDYIELSASLSTSTAKNMASRYLIVALMLREHGRPEEGLDMLNIAVEEISQYAEDKNDAKIWVDKLQSFIRSWDGTFSARASHSLGPPLMEKKKKKT